MTDDETESKSEYEFDPEDSVDSGNDDVVDAASVGGSSAAGAPAEELRGLVTYLATSLVDDPESVQVTVEQRGPSVHLRLQVPQEELGKVIGRQGRIARAMRTAVMIAGARSNLRASLDIDG